MSIFSRLFKEHGGLTFLLGLSWMLVVAMAVIGPEDPRQPNTGILLVIWSIPLILTSFAWMNARHYQQSGSVFRKRVFTWGSALADFIIFAIIFAIPAAILAPAYGNYAVRSRMNEMIGAVSDLKTGIAEIAQADGIPGNAVAALKIRKPEYADYALLSPDGTIVLYNERYGALAVISPVITSNGIQWRCQGFPADLFPGNCRGEVNAMP